MAKRGFTLIEVLLTLGLLAVIGGFSLVVGVGDVQCSSGRSTYEDVVVLLMRARAESLHGVCKVTLCTEGPTHGVHREGSTFTLFEGESFGVRAQQFDEVLDLPNTQWEGAQDIMFAPHTGAITVTPTTVWTLTLKVNAEEEHTITLTHEGKIDW